MESPVNQTIPGAKPATGEKRAISVEAFVFLGVFILILDCSAAEWDWSTCSTP